MKEMKRVLALVLCFVMLVGVVPVGALAAEAETTAPSETVAEAQTMEAAAAAATTEAAEIETSASAEEVALAEANEPAAYSVTTDPRSAVFCSDVHGSTSDLSSTFTAIANAGAVPSLVGFVGDTCLTMSTVDSTVNSALGCDPVVVYSYAASHDTENGSDIGNDWDMSTLAYTGDYFNVYVIRETDMQNANSDAVAVFNSKIASIDTTKPLFILSHRPLHERRNDNAGAAIWYDAISAAAEKIDIVFLWGHNHTSENSVDTAAYYVEKDGTETITIEGGDTVVPNFTYMNAGYINANNQNPGRIGVATTVYVADDSLVFQDYNSSGEYTGTYAHNVTVAREFAKTESAETTDPTESTESTESTDPVVTAPDRIEVSGTDAYTVGDTLHVTVKGYTYSTDGTTDVDIALADCEVAVSCPDGHECTLDTVMNTIATGEDGTYHQVTVTYMGVSDDYQFTVGEAADLGNSELGVGVSVNAAVTGAVTVAESTNENVAAAMETAEVTTYKAYDITTELAMDAGNYATVTLPIPEGVETPVVYYVSDDGATVTDMKATDNGDGTVSFVTDHFSTYAVGAAGNEKEEDLTGTDAKVENAEVTTTTPKTVYVLTSSISAGNAYLIANSNSASTTTRYLLANNSGSVAATGVTIQSGDVDGDGDTETYIELDDATDELWTVSNSYRFQNNGYYLRYNNGLGLSTSNYTTWTYSSAYKLYYNANTDRYLRYNNGWTTTTSSSSASSIYFYVPTEIDVETTTTMNGTYSIAGEPVTKVVENGTTATLSSTLTFTPESGDATTEDVSSTAAYTIYKDTAGVISGINGNTITFSGTYGSAIVMVSYTKTINGTDYTVTNYIQVTATEPTYKIDIIEMDGGKDDTITDTIVIKGETEMADGYNLDHYISYVDVSGESAATNVDITKITWTSSNEGIAKVEKDSTTGHATVTFPGGEGSVQITVYYEYADGKQVMDYVNISVSKSSHTIPADGTDDFPDYPDQGAIRINKTADAVGNFSETGMAKVELSMTGMPYGTSVKTDVVVMVDMTSSMEENDITAAQLAVQELIESVVYDSENDVYDENIQLFVSSFSSGTSTSNIVITDHLNNVTIGSDEELADAKAVITDSTNGFRDDRHTTNGTHYGVALADVYATLTRDGHAENQFVVFVTDGVPTRYYYLNSSGSYTEVTGQNSDTSSLAAGWFDSEGEVTDDFQTEYYTYLIKNMGVPVYTVGANLSDGSDASDLINHMSSNYTADGKTSTGETKYSFTCTTSGGITDEVLAIFKGIGEDIKEAATNVQVVDKVGSNYTMTFKLPNNVSADDTGMDEFYIQVVEYTLDQTTKERVDANNDGVQDHTVKEKFLFNADGTLNSHTSAKGTSCTGDTCTHVTFTDGVVTAINGDYFTYSSTNEGEFLTWDEEKISTTELALQYFAYLDKSAGFDVADQVDPGSYYTNDYAYVTYTNFNGTECRLDFPQPQMTWSGAQVTYVFYLVNENGEPVNRAGRVIPFANRVEVTDAVTKSITWYSNDDKADILAEDLFAIANVPDVYQLYDENAEYVVRVYETEGVDTNAVNYNYFTIGGSDQTALNAAHTDRTATNASLNTTKVYTTVAGSRYDTYGVYSKQAEGTVLNTTDKDGNPTTVTVTEQVTDIDYANTTVAFAVVWKPELQPDTVVIDYGLDVVINVSTNDALASGVVGVRADAPAGVAMNSGTYEAAKASSADIYLSDNTTKIATATTEPGSIQSVRFSLDKENGMQFTKPAVFYYESDCNYYKNGVLKTDSMYSQVTVIPATTVYYEDEYVTTLEYHTGGSTITGIADGGWGREGSTITATQAVDRPGVENGMSASYDANNEYGYDEAYGSSTTLSMGSALKVNVSGTDYAIAEFDFYGTGFDLISMTGNDTGVITVKVKDESGNVVKNIAVDTYYGYTYGVCNVEYEWDGYNWFRVNVSAKDDTTATKDASGNILTKTPKVEAGAAHDNVIIQEETWQPCSTDEAIYQVPVIKADLETWGKYTVRINAAYHTLLDHVEGSDNYNFYLDAIRIYDPMPEDTTIADDITAGDIYAADNEGWPDYTMVRDILVDAQDFNATTEAVDGVVFIDGNGETSSIDDYASYGPNNEVYLAANQAIAFEISNLTNVADVQLGLKCATEGNVIATLSIYDGTTLKSSPGIIENTDSAADRYYSIGSYLKGITTPVVVIQNTGTGILSITNVKTTYKSAPTEATAVDYRMSPASANVVLMMLNAQSEEEAVILPDAELEVSVSKTTVKEGGSVQVKITTSEDVDALSVNGQEVTAYKQNKKTGKRTWTLKVKAEEAGELKIAVIAYSDGYELDTVTETVQVTAKKSGNANKGVGQLLDKLFG